MGTPLGWHIGMRLADDRVLASTPHERRLLSRGVLRHGERARLVAYRAVDTHLHAELLCERAEVGRFTRSVGSAVAAALGRQVPLHMSFVKPIADQRHGLATLRYILGQERHHGLDSDPFHEASNLPDLLGLRVLGAHTARVLGQAFPRVRRLELLEAFGGAASSEAQELELLEDAAAAAFALPDLRGRGPEIVVARRAAVQAAGRAATAGELARLLGAGVRTVERLRLQPCGPDLVAAVRGQWRLRSGWRASTPTRAAADGLVATPSARV
ncbi:MAG: hypothetical protein IT373_24065 [Polyangiaceae bacterium]|nr:hypothetical protein [Polyangiaceae bacterium]